MFKFFKDRTNLRKLRTVRKKLKEIDENKQPPKFPYTLLEDLSHYVVHKNDYGDDATSYINDVIHGKQSPIRDVSSPKYTYREKINISINFWDIMEKWCAKNKEFCKTTLIDDAALKKLKKDEEDLLRELGL